jgi:hypothetical protein
MEIRTNPQGRLGTAKQGVKYGTDGGGCQLPAFTRQGSQVQALYRPPLISQTKPDKSRLLSLLESELRQVSGGVRSTHDQKYLAAASSM